MGHNSERLESLLKAYSTELLRWNKTHNLIGKTTEKEIYNRHIEDSLQLIDIVDKYKATNIVDFGSGAGLPIMILAIYYSINAPHISFEAFEANNKKTTFLNYIAAKLNLNNIKINTQRIESFYIETKADIITARAFSALVNIFDMSQNYISNSTKFILHKGINVEAEIAEAKHKYNFEYKLTCSKTGEGYILECEELQKIQ